MARPRSTPRSCLLFAVLNGPPMYDDAAVEAIEREIVYGQPDDPRAALCAPRDSQARTHTVSCTVCIVPVEAPSGQILGRPAFGRSAHPRASRAFSLF
jgi:hypothetical protein